MDPDNQPTGYMGLVVAANKDDLFWEIDQYGDPYSVEVMKATRASFCIQIDQKEEEVDYDEFELSEYAPLMPEDGEWVKPVYNKNPYK